MTEKRKSNQEISKEYQAIAAEIINQQQHDKASAPMAKALRVLWQTQLVERTGCAPFTARVQIAKALRRARYQLVEIMRVVESENDHD